MRSDVNRLVVRQYINYSSVGTKERDVVAPEGYRVVSGHAVVAEDEDGNYGDLDLVVGYPKVDPNGVLCSDTWRFQFKLNAACAIWMFVICERSDEPDVLIDYPNVYTS